MIAIATAESVWDQIIRQHLCKETHVLMERAKDLLRAWVINLMNLGNNQILKDKKKINITKNLRKDFFILKPNRGNGIVLIKATECYTSGWETVLQIGQKLNKCSKIQHQQD